VKSLVLGFPSTPPLLPLLVLCSTHGHSGCVQVQSENGEVRRYGKDDIVALFQAAGIAAPELVVLATCTSHAIGQALLDDTKGEPQLPPSSPDAFSPRSPCTLFVFTSAFQ
jgi:hypothetical protein